MQLNIEKEVSSSYSSVRALLKEVVMQSSEKNSAESSLVSEYPEIERLKSFKNFSGIEART